MTTTTARGILLHNDNTSPHSAHLTQAIIAELEWEVLERPAYSPDVPSSDYHMFGPPQRRLGTHFQGDNGVQEEDTSDSGPSTRKRYKIDRNEYTPGAK
ncbi:putative steroid hormone mediated signaling pathway [Trypoxylus dichotomus]